MQVLVTFLTAQIPGPLLAQYGSGLANLRPLSNTGSQHNLNTNARPQLVRLLPMQELGPNSELTVGAVALQIEMNTSFEQCMRSELGQQ